MNGIRKIGVVFGVLAFTACILAGCVVICPVIGVIVGIGMFFIGTGFFFASVLILIGSDSSGKAAVKKAKPAKSPVRKKVSAAKDKPKPKPKSGQNNKVAIYAGNLSPEATEDDLRRAFEPFGQVLRVNVVMDKYRGKSKGYGFVEMPVKKEALAAIEALNDHEMAGRKLSVSVARSMPKKGNSGPRRRPGTSANN